MSVDGSIGLRWYMRGESKRETYKKTYRALLLCCLIVAASCGMFTCFVQASEEQRLLIVLYDHEPNTGIPKQDNIFFEGRQYGVLIVYEIIDENGEVSSRNIAYDTLITVPWGSYMTSQAFPEITLTAPEMQTYREFIITASKQGHTSAEKLITVIKGELTLTTDRGIVQEGDGFTAIVRDHNNQPVADVIVYIDREGEQESPSFTNAQGISYLTAPLIDSENRSFVLIALKDGYKESAATLRVEKTPPKSFGADIISILPIIIALILVILAMVIVRLLKPKSTNAKKQKRDEDLSDDSEYKQKRQPSPQRRHTLEPTVQISQPSSIDGTKPTDAKIEEIRIRPAGKRKETTYLIEEEKKPHHISDRKKTEEVYYKGTDELGYTIDKITGKIDETKKDKWFEGTDAIREKVDIALKKKKQKQDDEEKK